MKSVHIFQPGTHTAMSGQSVVFGESDLAASVAAYDPSLHEAPVVVGHPRHDAPAYGWVQSLATDGQGMHAQLHQVDAAFAEMVGAGRFKKVSASFYQPDAPGNPKPGVYYLRHVGFLGAQPPSIKGLRPVEFSEAEEGVIEFADMGLEIGSGLWRRMREWLIAQFGQDTADRVVPGWEIDSLADAARASREAPQSAAAPEGGVAFTEHQPNKQEMSVSEKERAQALEVENARLKEKLEQEEQRKRADAHAANVQFAEGLVAAGMKPAHLDVVVAALDFSEANPDAPLEFGEGAAKQPLSAALRAVFSELSGAVSFSEQATTHRASNPESVNPLLADAEARSKP
ncbi:peptidase [Alcaligenaceae bacterium]|nr:peptidase [Alcaligenaceae bacterium]